MNNRRLLLEKQKEGFTHVSDAAFPNNKKIVHVFYKPGGILVCHDGSELKFKSFDSFKEHTKKTGLVQISPKMEISLAMAADNIMDVFLGKLGL